jgi:hypothetical protein
MPPLDPRLARDAKTIALFAFRNGPIENLHAGKDCPLCAASEEYSHITDDEMKLLMQSAVNEVYHLLWQRENDPDVYSRRQALADRYTRQWDDPVPKT